jgi:3-deoxy-manno-octulosonate cytidylyltransferase (CMP-KDO synthetase)
LIPARYASSRFPAKALADLGGKPMVAWVCERAAASGAASVTVATDDERIRDAVEKHGYRTVMTSADHVSGTDRIAEAARTLRLDDAAIVVNVQGDEPLIPAGLIGEVAALLVRDHEASMSTICHAIHDEASLGNPNVVKVVFDGSGRALYFSRSRIPFPREPGGACYRHVGIYGYRAGFLKKFATLPEAPLEKTEALEQLRALWHGYRIAVAVSDREMPPEVNTPQDLERVRRMLGQGETK